ncbi:MAG TPA: YXWGXW repeat-containing protein [Candidatus Baltobacteraceae bacterium]|jgi:hypothetical protein|nr:YXWGXW repeat-containing protein [Candidatus Baltobacteraceae bacterium]
MYLTQNVRMRLVRAPALMAAALGLLAAGCSSQSPPQPQPPAAQAAFPPPALTADQMAQVCQAAPDTCHRIQTAQPLTLVDVKVMAKIGIGSDAIISQVRNSHTVYHLSANDIIDLKNFGVSNQVIDFLITTPNSIGGSTPVPEPLSNSSTAQTPPPAPPLEIASEAPAPDYVWINGDWVWNGGWVWVGGHWVLPPFRGAVWINGRWGRGWGGYRHVRGHWR